MGTHTYICGHTRNRPGVDMTWKHRCYTCRSAEIGTRIQFVRYGAIPASGHSINWAQNTAEEGVAVYRLLGNGVHEPTLRAEFASRIPITGTAVMVGTGSDDEPIIDATTIILDQPVKTWEAIA